MRIESVAIENLRSFASEVVRFDDYTCMVGANGSGKSTVMCALNIFFRESSHSRIDLTCLHEEDFHKRNTANPISITVTFTDLSDEAKVDFAAYVRHEKLTVTAKAQWDPVKMEASVVQFGQRLGLDAFRPFFAADSNKARVDDLKEIFSGLREAFPDLPAARTKEQMTEALRTYEEARPIDCVLIPSQDQFYGFSSGKNLLDKHLQWVYLPAVKEVSDEQTEGKTTALGKLLARTVRSQVSFSDKIKGLRDQLQTNYQGILDESQGELDAVSAALRTRLQYWSHPNADLKVSWKFDKDKSLKVDEPFAALQAGEGAFAGELARLGHGLQRSIMIALLQELSGHDQEGAPTLILAIEEPELYQHPPQARYLADVLSDLADDGCQILVCSHSPVFVSGEHFDSIRLIRKSMATHESSVVQVTVAAVDAATAAAEGNDTAVVPEAALIKLHQILRPGVNEIFFAPVVVLVEGMEDVAFITAFIHLTGRWEHFRRLGCHIVHCQNKTGIIRPRAICELFSIPSFVVFDADGDKYRDPNNDPNGNRAKHERDNRAILALCGHGGEDPFSGAVLSKPNMVMWPENIAESVKSDVNSALFDRIANEVCVKYGQVGNIQKDELFIGDLLAGLINAGATLPKLDALCESILTFATTTEHSVAEAPDPAALTN